MRGTARTGRCAGAALCAAARTTLSTTSFGFSARMPCFAATASTEGSGAAAAASSAAWLGKDAARAVREEEEDQRRSAMEPPAALPVGLPLPAESVGEAFTPTRTGAGAAKEPALPEVPERGRDEAPGAGAAEAAK